MLCAIIILIICQNISGICMCSMLIPLSSVSNLFQNGKFPISAYFGGHLCYHSNGKSQSNTRPLHLGYFSHKSKKRAKIRNRYNQAPHLTQNTNGKVTTLQLDITNKSQAVSPFPAGDHKASINRRARKHNKNRQINKNDPQKKHRLRTVSKNIILEGLNWFYVALTSPLVQMWIKAHRSLVCMTDP